MWLKDKGLKKLAKVRKELILKLTSAIWPLLSSFQSQLAWVIMRLSFLLGSPGYMAPVQILGLPRWLSGNESPAKQEMVKDS